MNKLFKDSDYFIPPKIPRFFSQTACSLSWKKNPIQVKKYKSIKDGQGKGNFMNKHKIHLILKSVNRK